MTGMSGTGKSASLEFSVLADINLLTLILMSGAYGRRNLMDLWTGFGGKMPSTHYSTSTKTDNFSSQVARPIKASSIHVSTTWFSFRHRQR